MTLVEAIESVLELVPNEAVERRTLVSVLQNAKEDPGPADTARRLLVSGLLSFMGVDEPPAWGAAARARWDAWLGLPEPPKIEVAIVGLPGEQTDPMAVRRGFLHGIGHAGGHVLMHEVEGIPIAVVLPSPEDMPGRNAAHVWAHVHQLCADALGYATRVRVELQEAEAREQDPNVN